MSVDQFSFETLNKILKDAEKLKKAVSSGEMERADTIAVSLSLEYQDLVLSQLIAGIFSRADKAALQITLWGNFTLSSHVRPYTLKKIENLPSEVTLKFFEGDNSLTFLPDGRDEFGAVDMRYYNTEEPLVFNIDDKVRKYLFKVRNRFFMPFTARLRVLWISLLCTIGEVRFYANPYVKMAAYYYDVMGGPGFFETGDSFRYEDKDPLDMMSPIRSGLLFSFSVNYEIYGNDFVYNVETFEFLFQDPYANGALLKKMLTDVKFLFCSQTTSGIAYEYTDGGKYHEIDVIKEDSYFKSQEEAYLEGINMIESYGLHDLLNQVVESISANKSLENYVKYSFLLNASPLFGRTSVLYPLVNSIEEFKDLEIDVNSEEFDYYTNQLSSITYNIFRDTFNDYGVLNKQMMAREIVSSTRNASFGESIRVFYNKNNDEKFTKNSSGRGSVSLQSSQQSFVNFFDPNKSLKAISYSSINLLDQGLNTGVRFVPGGKDARPVLVSPNGTAYLGIFFNNVYLSARKYFSVLRRTGNALINTQIIIKGIKDRSIVFATDFSSFDLSQNNTNVFDTVIREVSRVLSDLGANILKYEGNHSILDFAVDFLVKSFNFPITFEGMPLVLQYDGKPKAINIKKGDDSKKIRRKLEDVYNKKQSIFNQLPTGHKTTLAINSIVTKAVNNTISHYFEKKGVFIEYSEQIGDDSFSVFKTDKDITSELLNELRDDASEISNKLGFKINKTKTIAAEVRGEFTQEFFVQGVAILKPIQHPFTVENIDSNSNILENAEAAVSKMFGSIQRNTMTFDLARMIMFMSIFSFFRLFEKGINKLETTYSIPLSYLFCPQPFGLGVFYTFDTLTRSNFVTLKSSLKKKEFEYLIKMSKSFENISVRSDSVQEVLRSEFFNNFNDKLVKPSFGDRIPNANKMLTSLKNQGRSVSGFDVSAPGRALAVSIAAKFPKGIYFRKLINQFSSRIIDDFKNIDLEFTAINWEIVNLLPYKITNVNRIIPIGSSYAYNEQILNDYISIIGLTTDKTTIPGVRSNLGNAILKRFDRNFPTSFTDEQLIRLIKISKEYRNSIKFIADNLIAAGYDPAASSAASKNLFEQFNSNYNLEILNISIFNEFSQKLNVSLNSMKRFFNYKSIIPNTVQNVCFTITLLEVMTKGPYIYLEFDITNLQRVAKLIEKNKLSL